MMIEGNPLKVSVGSMATFTSKSGKNIKASVEEILDDKLILKLKKAGKTEPIGYGKIELSKVYFKPNEIMIKGMIRGISGARFVAPILFPSESQEINTKFDKLSSIAFSDNCMNKEQQNVVRRICNYSSRHPFILFGPPGTGKTRTLCEAVKQLYFRNAGRIIVAAPSNTAVDIIVKDLVKAVPKGEILRLVSYARSKKIDEDIFCVSSPRVDKINYNVKILCGTLQVLSKVQESDFCASYIFVDEAGQSSEPEVLVVWPRLLVWPHGQLILAGDPHQLGPVVCSEGAKFLGLGKSMMQRLMEFPLYKRNRHFDEKYVIQLVKNYRSLPELLTVPNKLFYEKTLVPMAVPRSKKIISPEIFGHKSPLIFYENRTRHEKPENMTSLQNVEQANHVNFLVGYMIRQHNVAKVNLDQFHCSIGNDCCFCRRILELSRPTGDK